MPSNITVLIAGVVDPKWPASALNLGGDPDGAGSGHQPAAVRRLSPFDEAALECALKIRDADPEARIAAIVAGAGREQCEALMRAAAAFRLDQLLGFELPAADLWDAQATGQRLARAVAEGGAVPDLVLMGREFGDYDDGAVAPCLAETLAWPFVGLAQEVRVDGAARVFMRQRGDMEEHVRIECSAVASVTNAKTNRLRFPLMKNVAAAKRERFNVVNCDPAASAVVRRLISIAPAPAEPRGSSPCRMLPGSAEEQAAQLADYLRSAQAMSVARRQSGGGSS